MFSSLDHLVIAVRDLELATATYSTLLGRQPSWCGAHPGAGTANTLYRLDRTYVELLAAVGPGPLAETVRTQLAAAGEGPFALALGTGDARACAAMLRSRGIAAAEPVDGSGREDASGAEREWCSVALPLADTRGVRIVAIEHRTAPAALPYAPAPDPAAAVAGVDHVVIMTGDAERAAVLYRDALGLRLAFDRTFPERGLRLLFFRVGGVTIELAAPLAGGAERDRFWGVSWRVDDIDAVHARLRRCGVQVSPVRAGHKAGTRVCTVGGETHGVATLCIEQPRLSAAPGA
jgi:catechol 2,3-dioxygenase-like lactoylglutathione lyase family enzyme